MEAIVQGDQGIKVHKMEYQREELHRRRTPESYREFPASIHHSTDQCTHVTKHIQTQGKNYPQRTRGNSMYLTWSGNSAVLASQTRKPHNSRGIA